MIRKKRCKHPRLFRRLYSTTDNGDYITEYFYCKKCKRAFVSITHNMLSDEEDRFKKKGIKSLKNICKFIPKDKF